MTLLFLILIGYIITVITLTAIMNVQSEEEDLKPVDRITLTLIHLGLSLVFMFWLPVFIIGWIIKYIKELYIKIFKL